MWHPEQCLGHRQHKIESAIDSDYSAISVIALKIPGHRAWAQCDIHLSREENITRRRETGCRCLGSREHGDQHSRSKRGKPETSPLMQEPT